MTGSPKPVLEQTLHKADSPQKRCDRKTNNRVKEPVDFFVFLVCVVFIAGYFRGVFPDFLAVFPVLWFLGCLSIPSSLETSLCGIEC